MVRQEAIAGLVTILLLACSGPQRSPTRQDPDAAVISFDCPISDAEVWVDGRFFEEGLRRGIAIGPGTYRIEIRHDRYHTFYAEVTVEKRARRVITVRLAEILP